MLQAEQVLQGRYALQQSLGQNAGRQTWLAQERSQTPPHLVILKLLAFSPQMQWDELKLFEREAQVLKHLDHPRIPKYRDYFSLDRDTGKGLCWFALVQDYIPGQSLQQLLDEGKRFTEEQVCSIATQVLKILMYLHGLNPPVLHRDIKPSNLIWTEDEQVYLVDFGAVADPTAVEGATFTVVGTAGYAPLEQFWGKAVPASDLYALGATLIHLLTGTAPADLPQSNLRIQFQGQVSVSPSFVRWVATLTQPDLGRRFNSAKQALNALQSGHSLNSLHQKVPSPASRVQLRLSPSQLTIKIPRQEISSKGLRELLQRLIRGVCLLAFLLSILIGQSISLALGGRLLMFFLPLISKDFIHVPNYRIVNSLLFLSGDFFIALLLLLILVFSIYLGYLGLSVVNKLVRLIAQLWKEFFSYFAETFLSFSEDNFLLEERFFGWCYRRIQRKTADIRNLKAVPQQGITVLTKTQKYKFARFLTDSECKWLVQEIQDWL